jgi:hypothetical protein
MKYSSVRKEIRLIGANVFERQMGYRPSSNGWKRWG